MMPGRRQRFNQGLIKLVLLLMLRPSDVIAAEHVETVRKAGESAGYMSSGYLVQLIVGLVLVLVCIVVLAWFAKRFRYLQTSTAGSMQVLGGISMGARERVVLMQVGSTRLLLGVAPGRINTLHVLEQTFDKTGADDEAPTPPECFAVKLGAALLRGGKK
jgi:flagellar protein FliO/FliZ